MEYATTYTDLHGTDSRGYQTPILGESQLAPVCPEGEGWKMVGSAANESFLFWFWERSS